VDAYGDSGVASDLAAYRSEYGLPACTIASGCLTVVNQSGRTSPPPADDAAWAGETALDVEMVSAVCPSCRILLVQAGSAAVTDLQDAVRTATRLGAKYVSMSWGTGEWPREVSSADPYTFAAAGVAYVAASGDDGYATGWPAVSPRVVSVGGTSLSPSASTPRGFTEKVWFDGHRGTGSGCSGYEPRPAWQYIAPVTSLCPRRAENDVAVLADPSTGVAVVSGGQWAVYGGTSAGAPMIAALYAIAGGAGRVPAPALLYAHRAVGAFLDITGGATSCSPLSALCRAAPGWDGPTGVGVPQGIAGFAQVDPGTVHVHNPGSVTSWAGAAVKLDTAAGDSQNYRISYYRARGLPRGTAISTGGYLTGRPKAAGSYRVTVRATDSLGTTGATTFAWTVRLHHIVTGARPHIAGIIRRGHTVRAAFGGWHRDRATGASIHPRATFRWFLDGRRIRGATRSSLWLHAAWRGHRVSVRVTAARRYYAGYRHTTAAVRVR
jgi:hypothetical protein